MSLRDSCAICGRTFLVGERVDAYVSGEGRHDVCPLCADRAVGLGWLPADQEGAEEATRSESEHRPGFFARLFARPQPGDQEEAGDEDERRPELVDDAAPPAEAQAEAAPTALHELETEAYDVEAEWRVEEQPPRPAADHEAPRRPRRRRPWSRAAAEPPRGDSADLPAPEEVPDPEKSPAPDAPAPGADAWPAPLPQPRPLPDPAGRGMRPRRLQPDLSPATRFERAISRFNAGDAGRTAAGLTRTLGTPSVSVGDLAGEEDVVRITVAWELTWYQWGVDLGDELRPVFELARGFEVEEIDSAARQWNASAHDGRVVLVAPDRAAAGNGSPVHR